MVDFLAKILLAKMHFWFLYFGPIFILVSKLILHQPQSLKIDNYIYFGLCHHPLIENSYMTNGGTVGIGKANVAIKIILKNYLAFKKCHIII